MVRCSPKRWGEVVGGCTRRTTARRDVPAFASMFTMIATHSCQKEPLCGARTGRGVR